MIYAFENSSPNIASSAFISDTAAIIGDVVINADANVWFGAVLRADSDRIIIGNSTSVQDNVVIHCDVGLSVQIGDFCIIGHNVTLHGCNIENNVIVGMGAVVLNSAKIGKGSIIGAGSVIVENSVIPPNALVIGVPGKVVKIFEPPRTDTIKIMASYYVDLKNRYLKSLKGCEKL